MLQRTLLAIILATLTAVTLDIAAADDLEARLVIDAATVGPEGATVSRRGSIALPAGRHQLVISDLPGGTDPDTLTIDVDAPGVTIGAVATGKKLSADYVSPAERDLRNKLENLQDGRTAIQDRIATAETELKLLDSLAAAPGGGEDATGINSASLGGVLATLSARSTQARTAIRTARAELRKQDAEIARMEGELKKIATEQKASSLVRASLRVEAPVTASVRVSYRVARASWTYTYAARLDTKRRIMRLERQAMLQQATGEDWRDTQVTLTTAEAADELTATQLQSWFLDLEPEERPARQQAAGLSEIVVSARKADEVAPVASAYASDIRLPGRIDVPANNEPRAFPVTALDVPVELVSRVAPAISRRAQLEALAQFKEESPFFGGGSVEFYLDGAYVGSGDTPRVSPGQKTSIPFGPDNRVGFRLFEEEAKSGEAGLLGRYRRQEFRGRVEVSSTHSEPVTVEVIDRLPVPRSQDIKIDVLKGATPATETDVGGNAGVLLWRKELPPGQTAVIRHYYSITYPADRAYEAYEE